MDNGVWWHEKKTANAMKETLKETNRLKSNCSANSHIYTLFIGHCLLPCGLLAMWPSGLIAIYAK